MKPILVEIPSKKEYTKPYYIHLKDIVQSLKVAILNSNKEEIHKLKLEIHGLLSIIEHAQFELAQPHLSKTTRDDNTLRYEKENPPQKIWTMINGERVEFEKKAI